MAKVINLIEGRKQEKKNDWRKTLTGRDKEQLKDGSVAFASEWDFPICNHKNCVTSDNIGYVQGLLEDNRPFEAELFLANGGCILGVIMPVLEWLSDPIEKRDGRGVPVFSKENSKVRGLVRQAELKDNGVLPIGMVEEGEAGNSMTIMLYTGFLEDMGILTFLGKERNGYVEYLTDINGNDLVRVLVTLQYENGEVVATTPLRFKRFLSKEMVETYFEVLDKKIKAIEENWDKRPDLPLSNEVLKKLHLKNIAFIYFAEEGACGTPGNLAVYTKENDRGVCYAGNYVYDASIEAKNVNKLIRPLIAFAGEGKNTEAPFKHYYMGMGNHWYVNKAYVKDVDSIKGVLTEDGLFARKKAIAYMLLDRD